MSIVEIENRKLQPAQPLTKIFVVIPQTAETEETPGTHGELIYLRCGTEEHEIVSCCEKLSPCVLVVSQELITRFDSQILRALTGPGRSVQVLVRTVSDDSEIEAHLLRSGCAGFVPQSAGEPLLERAIRAVSAGELWTTRRALADIVRGYIAREAPAKLTPRETDILRLKALGYTNKEIAQSLALSHETVRWHVRRLNTKTRATKGTPSA